MEVDCNDKDVKEPCVLHFTRVRGKGEPDFYEPNTDIRKVFPAVANIAAGYLKETFKEDERLYKELDYLYRCFKIFQIRVAEDKTPVAQQLSEYVEAIGKADPAAVALWRETQFRAMASLYSLFCRRDAATDSQMLHGMLEAARLSLYKDNLSEATYKAMEAELTASGTVAKDTASTSTRGMVACIENGQVIDSIKTIAATFLNATGSTEWNDLADACDREFSTQSGKMTDEQAVCVALAYPSYEHNDLGVEVTKDL